MSASQEIEALKAIRESPKMKQYLRIKKTYDEFKELRKALGKPVTTTINPERIRRDLSGTEFSSLIEEIEKKQQTEKKGLGTRKT